MLRHQMYCFSFLFPFLLRSSMCAESCCDKSIPPRNAALSSTRLINSRNIPISAPNDGSDPTTFFPQFRSLLLHLSDAPIFCVTRSAAFRALKTCQVGSGTMSARCLYSTHHFWSPFLFCCLLIGCLECLCFSPSPRIQFSSVFRCMINCLLFSPTRSGLVNVMFVFPCFCLTPATYQLFCWSE